MKRARFLLLGFCTAVAACAQTTYTWTGFGANDLFSNPANWQGGLVPTGNTTDHIVFPANPRSNVRISAPVSVGDITFNGIQNGQYLVPVPDSGATLTLNGNVTTTAGSTYWGLFDLPVILAAGNHTYTTAGTASIYHFGVVSGSGGITKNGLNGLFLVESNSLESNSYSGGTILNAGTLYVGSTHALGYGTVTLNGGTLATAYASDDITLSNDFLLGSAVNFNTSDTFNNESAVSLTLGNNDGSDIAPITGVTNVTLTLTGTAPLYLGGDLSDGSAATTYTFASSTPGSRFVLSASNTYTGGTVVTSGATVIFDGSNALPATGPISVASEAYVGLESSGADAAAFVARFNPANSAGTIGFDGDNSSYSYSGDIDLSNFTANSGEISLGTLSTATLTGTITPPTASGEYRFRNSGTLFIEGALTGSNSVLSYSFDGRTPGLLVLNQPYTSQNSYSGATRAVGAGIIFASPDSLSSSTNLALEHGGYMGVTEFSGVTLDDLISEGVTVNDRGVLGLDSYNILIGDGSPYAYSGAVDFGSLSSPVYLGTASGAVISGAITTTNGGADDYYFTGYTGGYLQVNTQLTGGKQVHIGLPGIYQGENGTVSAVELFNITNSFTGGIVLHSGQLSVQNSLSLGTGPLTVNASADDGMAYLDVLGTVPNAINLQNGTLSVYAGGPLVLGGTISGSGALASSFGSPLTISGNNSYTGGTSFEATPVTVTTNGGLGTGSLSLTEGAKVTFTSSAPIIGSLLRGDQRDYFNGEYTEYYDAALIISGGGSRTLTINQAVEGFFYGSILEDGTTAALVKSGPGALYIGGDNAEELHNTYSGGTTITGGKLIAGAPHALGTGTITLNGGALATSHGLSLSNAITFGASGGKLSGNTTFSTPITAGANVVLSPGDSPGTMTFTAGLTLASGGSVAFEVQAATGAAGTGYDLVSISSGAFSIMATSGSPFTIQLLSLNGAGTAGNVSDFSSATGYSWMLFVGNSTGGLSGFIADKFIIDASGFTNPLNGGVFSLTQGLNGADPALYLNFSPVPEPSTYALLGAGLVLILLAARRRRSTTR